MSDKTKMDQDQDLIKKYLHDIIKESIAFENFQVALEAVQYLKDVLDKKV